MTISKIYCIMRVRRDVLKYESTALALYRCSLSKTPIIIDVVISFKNMIWDKKNDGSKLNNLFAKRKNREGLDWRRRDRNYIEAARAKNFPTVNTKKFVPIYNRKGAKIDVEHKLKGASKTNSKVVFLTL